MEIPYSTGSSLSVVYKECNFLHFDINIYTLLVDTLLHLPYARIACSLIELTSFCYVILGFFSKIPSVTICLHFNDTCISVKMITKCQNILTAPSFVQHFCR